MAVSLSVSQCYYPRSQKPYGQKEIAGFFLLKKGACVMTGKMLHDLSTASSEAVERSCNLIALP